MFDPRQMEKAMRQMGVKTEEIEATEVVIKGSKNIVIRNPTVIRTEMKGQTMFQVSGEVREAAYTDDDVKMVAEKAEISADRAAELLGKTGGDIAEAIMIAKSKEE
jgi:nascent polypeptide-associated complex subunit alpha